MQPHREIFEIFHKYFMKYFMKYFTPKIFMKFYIIMMQDAAELRRLVGADDNQLWTRLPEISESSQRF